MDFTRRGWLNPDFKPEFSGLERFRAKHALGLDPRVVAGSRKENALKQKSKARF
jgi:hypothetical protein